MRDPPEGFYKRLNGSLQNPPDTMLSIFFFLLFSSKNGMFYEFLYFLLLSSKKMECSRMFYNVLFSSFFYFFSVFWILLKFRYIYFMKSKERAGEWIFFLCNFSSIPLVFWLRWLRHLLFVWGCRDKRSASRVLFRGTAAEALDRLLVEKI